MKIQDLKSRNWPDSRFLMVWNTTENGFCENEKYGFSDHFYNFLWNLFRWYIIEKIFIKNGKNDKRNSYFSFSQKKFLWYLIPSKNENLANFSILNPESYCEVIILAGYWSVLIMAINPIVKALCFLWSDHNNGMFLCSSHYFTESCTLKTTGGNN